MTRRIKKYIERMSLVCGEDFSGDNITKISFKGKVISCCNFDYADMRRCNFEQASIMNCSFIHTDLRNVDLSQCVSIDYSCLINARLDGVKIEKGHTLYGQRPIFYIDQLDSQRRKLFVFMTKDKIIVKTGCFIGTVNAFLKAVKETHKGSIYETQYEYAIELAMLHFRKNYEIIPDGEI